jgi:hypothetical protein
MKHYIIKLYIQGARRPFANENMDRQACSTILPVDLLANRIGELGSRSLPKNGRAGAHPYRTFSSFVQTAPFLALLTAVAMKAMPMTPSSTVGKSTSLGIGLPATSASIARAASR